MSAQIQLDYRQNADAYYQPWRNSLIYIVQVSVYASRVGPSKISKNFSPPSRLNLCPFMTSPVKGRIYSATSPSLSTRLPRTKNGDQRIGNWLLKRSPIK